MDVIIYDLPERAEEIAVDQHEQGAPLEVVLATAARIAIGEKLREISDFVQARREEDLEVADYRWFRDYLSQCADELDPDGAR